MIELKEVTYKEVSKYIQIKVEDVKDSIQFTPYNASCIFNLHVFDTKNQCVMNNIFCVYTNPTGNCQMQSIAYFNAICWAVNCFDCPAYKKRKFGDIILYILKEKIQEVTNNYWGLKRQLFVDVNQSYLREIGNYFRPKAITKYTNTNGSNMANVLLWTDFDVINIK